MTTSAPAQKLDKFASFAHTVLEPSLAAILQLKSRLEWELSEYQNLHQQIQHLKGQRDKGPFSDWMDLGSEVFVQFAIPQTTFINLDLGLYGLHSQLTYEEAEEYIGKKTQIIQKRIDLATKKEEDVREQMKLVELAISEMMENAGSETLLKAMRAG